MTKHLTENIEKIYFYDLYLDTKYQCSVCNEGYSDYEVEEYRINLSAQTL
jgi:hypothetical protein